MRAGTSSGQAQSAILVPVPAAEAVVGRWRELYDPVATAGVPAHVTLIVPWLPPDEIGPSDIAELRDCLAGVPAFDFELTDVGWFGRRVLWVAPEPAGTFRAITNTLAERFGTPPWDDEFDDVVPHLTVAHASGDGVELGRVEDEVRTHLPVACRASDVWVMVGDGHHWDVEVSVSLAERSQDPPPVVSGPSRRPGRLL